MFLMPNAEEVAEALDEDGTDEEFVEVRAEPSAEPETTVHDAVAPAATIVNEFVTGSYTSWAVVFVCANAVPKNKQHATIHPLPRRRDTIYVGKCICVQV